MNVNGGFFTTTYNTTNAPASSANGGLSVGWNQSGGNADVDFYNIYNNAPTSFVFAQKTGASTYTNLVTIDNGGTVNTAGSITAGSFVYQSSDRRLKTNITGLDPQTALADVLKLQGVSFNWKKDGTPDIGLIAQDVQKVFPQLVSTDSTTGYEKLDYENLVAPLIEAVKEQQAEIDGLKAQVQTLEAEK